MVKISVCCDWLLQFFSDFYTKYSAMRRAHDHICDCVWNVLCVFFYRFLHIFFMSCVLFLNAITGHHVYHSAQRTNRRWQHLPVSLDGDIQISCQCVKIWCRSSRGDAAVRVKLLGLLTSAPSDCRHWQQLGRDVIAELVSRHREMLGRRGRCYANSVEHRRSHRVVTAVMLLEHYLCVWTSGIVDVI